MKPNNKFFLEQIMSQVQQLDEIGGPDTTEDYVEILEEVKTQVEGRIEMARQIASEEEE